MKEEINNKLDEIIDLIINNDKTIKLKDIKEKIYNDKDLKKYLDELHNIDNIYSNVYIKLKEQVINNQYIKEYRELENEFYYLILDINTKLNTLINKKVCK